jgi:hypothetical protein
MAEGLGRERWAHTSLLCALVANANRDPKRSRPLKPEDFDPYARQDRRERVVVDSASLAMLKEALTGRTCLRHGTP